MSTNGSCYEEEDYMSMALVEPEAPKFELSVQKRARVRRQAEARAHPKSKSERAAEEARARRDALAKHIDRSSRGFKILEKLGYKAGAALGPDGDRKDGGDSGAHLEPLSIEVKEGREGIGMKSEKKRKRREELRSDSGMKYVKPNEDDFRLRIAKENEDRRNEGLWREAMRVLEDIEDKSYAHVGGSGVDWQSLSQEPSENKPFPSTSPSSTIKNRRRIDDLPLRNVNVLYRTLIQERIIAEKEQHLRRELRLGLLSRSSVTTGTSITDGEEDDHRRLWNYYEGEVDDDESGNEDPELAAIAALEPAQRVKQVVEYLREEHRYCFWCKQRYNDVAMQGCPGPSEEDHE